jgi:tRNA dimethylallyltransferase
MKSKLPVILFVGPTAAGKTRIAIDVALRMKNAEIISCDSRLFYRGMNIGTAKPTHEEMRGVVHHMIDIADPSETLSLGEYQKQTGELIQQIHTRNHIPFLVGGTGQYIRAAVEGWDIPEVLPNPRLREFLEVLGKSGDGQIIQRWLQRLDPISYAQIDLRNPRRVLRALEVILFTGRPFSSQRVKTESPYHLIQIGLNMPRTVLFERIDARIDQMILEGFEDEARKLLENGIDPSLPSMSAIGYSEMAAMMTGKMSLDEAVTLMKRRTHAYVRRQANWFKADDRSIHWFDSRSCNVDDILKVINTELNDPSKE